MNRSRLIGLLIGCLTTLVLHANQLNYISTDLEISKVGSVENKIISWIQKESQVEVQTTEGKLLFTPQSENAVRVQYIQGKPDFLPEYVFIEKNTDVSFQIKESLSEVIIQLPKLIVYVNKEQGNLTFKDEKGNLLLREKEHGRTMFVNELENGKNHYVQQEFYSPSGEYLFGTGQFQDGYLNIKGLPRKLTQLNTQISIPFILSNKGYGLLWHNYGMTYFNPADNPILLTKTAQNSSVEQVDVTTTEGTDKKIVRQITLKENLQFLNRGNMLCY